MSRYNEILDESSMLGMLQETTDCFKNFNLDLTEDADWRAMISDASLRGQYTKNLAEGLNDKDARMFEKLSENIAEFSHLNEANTTAGFLPQAKLVMPLFRFMWPKLVAKELVNVIPMDSPEIVRYFFRPQAEDAMGNIVKLPSYAVIGNGTKFGTIDAPQYLKVGKKTNIFQEAITQGLVPASFDTTKATLTREVVLTTWAVLDSGTGSVVNSGSILAGQVDEEGKFSVTVDHSDGISVISGQVNFRNGDFVASVLNTSPQINNQVTHVGLIATILTSEYNQATKISFEPTKIRFQTQDMQLQAEWSVQWEQDQKARMGLDVQAEFISVFGNQIQLNIDNLILADIVSGVQKYNTANIQQFHKTPQRTNFAGTLKRYAEELLLYIEQASATIYNSTSLMPANYLAVNPKDLVWLKMLNGFDYKGDYGKDGTLGSSPIVGTFQNTYTVLSSPVVPAGKIIVAQKPNQESFAGYIYAPYVPISLQPWPMGPRPAMTVMSRFAKKMLKPECYGLIELV